MKLPLLKFVMTVFGPIIRLLYGVRIKGADNIPATGRVILSCNHLHGSDPILIGSTQKRLFRSMSKAELFENKALAWLIKNLGGFPINRGKSDIRGLATAMRILKSEQMLLIFPEGTRSKTGHMGSLHKGVVVLAEKTKAPIIPVYISEKRRPKLFGKTLVSYGRPVMLDELIEEYDPDSGMEKLDYAIQRLKEVMESLEEPEYEER